MSVSEERKRVLDLLASGKISVEDATSLLKALGPTPAEVYAAPLPPEPAVAAAAAVPAAAARAAHSPRSSGAPRPRARTLRISIAEVVDGQGKANIKVNVPLGLAKFALRFMPAQAKEELAAQSIDLNQLLDGLSEESPEGPIVDLETEKGDGSGKIARITIEVI